MHKLWRNLVGMAYKHKYKLKFEISVRSEKGRDHVATALQFVEESLVTHAKKLVRTSHIEYQSMTVHEIVGGSFEERRKSRHVGT